MKKSLTLFAFVCLLSTQSFAAYVIITKDGTRYNAKSKWTVVNGKAVVTLESGQTMTINPNEIDVAKTDEVNKLGMGNVGVIGSQQPVQTNTQKQAPSLGDMVKRNRAQQQQTAPPATTATTRQQATAPAAPSPVADQLGPQLKDTFERAYENVGIYERKMSGTNRSVRVELTADSEQKVFDAISATAFLIARNAGVEGIQIDMVELYMKTTTGGAAGRFQMNRADADSINAKAISIPDYFVHKVIY